MTVITTMTVKYDGEQVTGVANYTFFASFVRCIDLNDPYEYSCAETSAQLFEDLISGSMYPFDFQMDTNTLCQNAYST